MIALGIDTSNYTTSCALYDSKTDKIYQSKKLLSVKSGERGLRQSDAVFQHTQQLHCVLDELLKSTPCMPDAIGVSSRPRDVDGSYMPCFTVGLNTASCLSVFSSKPLYTFSHQSGHIAAAVYSSGNLSLLSTRFLAFHISGGTTEVLLTEPDRENIFTEKIICSSNDLNCGQAIDRCGVMLGLEFPCGKELESLAVKSDKKYNPKISITNGNCNLSGLENQCIKLASQGETKENISKYCLSFIAETIISMTEYALKKCGDIPLLYAGGVIADQFIRQQILKKYTADFAKPEYSCDNAAGIAYLTYLKEKSKCHNILP